MKKPAVIIISALMLLFLAGCAGKYYPEDTEKSIGSFKNILALKKQLSLDAENKSIREDLAAEIFSLDLERSKAAGVKDDNLPFFINKGSNTSVLLVHGFTASPWETKELGENLSEQGYNVYGVLLAGHGTDRSELRKTTWKDWYTSVKDAYEALDYISEKIFAVGISTGGSLSIALAEDYKIDGLVCLACPVYLRNENTRFIPILKYFYWYEKRPLTEEEKQHYYEYRPLESVEQLDNLIRYSSSGLHDITIPALIMQNQGDPTVDPQSADFIFNRINSTEKQIIYFDGDYHVLTKGKYKDEVFRLISEFIKERK